MERVSTGGALSDIAGPTSTSISSCPSSPGLARSHGFGAIASNEGAAGFTEAGVLLTGASPTDDVRCTSPALSSPPALAPAYLSRHPRATGFAVAAAAVDSMPKSCRAISSSSSGTSSTRWTPRASSAGVTLLAATSRTVTPLGRSASRPLEIADQRMSDGNSTAAIFAAHAAITPNGASSSCTMTMRAGGVDSPTVHLSPSELGGGEGRSLNPATYSASTSVMPAGASAAQRT